MKPFFAISCPIDTFSGYGARSRDLVKAIIETEKYDVKILPQRWGETPWNFITKHPEWHFLQQHIIQNNQLPKQPDIWMQITVPNEFQPIGKYNIGVTAGIETDIVSGPWVEGCNRMNLVITSSEFAKQTFINSKYEVKNQQGQLQGNIELKTPIEVIFEGANTNVYKILDKISSSKLSQSVSNIKESFAYLFVGHWLPGEFNEDRKNVGLLVKAFYETFKNKKIKPALILKTQCAGASFYDRDAVLSKIESIRQSVNSKDLPNIYLLHGEFSDEEINELYNHSKVKAMVSLTKGEGFGRPLLEFSLSKKPIITTNWSAHTEFLSGEFTTLMSGELRNVHKSATVENMIIPESKWFSVNLSEVGHYLKDVFENYKSYKEKANRQAYKSKTEFNWENMKIKLDTILSNSIPEFPKEIKLELPKLQLPKLEKING
jgi:glycosyltransferase involved in cell wall biosynthesis